MLFRLRWKRKTAWVVEVCLFIMKNTDPSNAYVSPSSIYNTIADYWAAHHQWQIGCPSYHCLLTDKQTKGKSSLLEFQANYFCPSMTFCKSLNLQKVCLSYINTATSAWCGSAMYSPYKPCDRLAEPLHPSCQYRLHLPGWGRCWGWCTSTWVLTVNGSGA